MRLQAIAKKRCQRKTGARGLRSILEHILLDIMYELPSITRCTKVVIDEAVINGENQSLLLIYENQRSCNEQHRNK